jgi:hypothetical protein
MTLRKAALAFLVVVMALVAAPMFAQDQGQPPSFAPDQLDQLVSRIALYPDPLLAQILAAATFPDQIPDAARWADQHHYRPAKLWPTRSRPTNFPGTPACKRCCHFRRCWT